MKSKLIFLFCLIGIIYQSQAQDTVEIPDSPRKFVSQHSGTFHGQKVNYTAILKETFLKNSIGENSASMWSTSYMRDGVDPKYRPVTFIFNGGPGSASIWLHMGFFGPKVVKVDSNAESDDGAAPYQLVDNPEALLDISDLVFIDPIGTGFSKVIGNGKMKTIGD